MTDFIREHNVILEGPRVRLRSLSERDWDTLLRWNQDPEVLYFADGDDVQSWNLEQVQDIYRGTSHNAFTFMMEFNGRPIGECWLQRMNLPRLLALYPTDDLRRIDLMIGEKELWGQGLGTEVIRLLTDFGFNTEQCDRVFACSVADYNPRSMAAFRKCGYEFTTVVAERPGAKARHSYDLALSRPKFLGQRQRPRLLNMAAALREPDCWVQLPAVAEVIQAPADDQILLAALPDFEVCCLDTEMEFTLEIARVARRLQLLVTALPLRRDVGEDLRSRGAAVVEEEPGAALQRIRDHVEAWR
jgi:RimJ/RimL family protein N-acetyltransferase